MERQAQIDQFLLDAHELAVGRLQTQPERVREVQQQLARWRERAGATRSDPYWDRWTQLLDGSVEDLRAQVCARTDAAAALRNVSPMSVLITQRERTQLFARVRQV